MNLIQIDVSIPKLFKAAQVGLKQVDTDYLIHSFLEETFGPRMVKPFCVPPEMQRINDQIRIVGYSDSTSEQLTEFAKEVAPVGFFNAIVGDVQHKPMPADWKLGAAYLLTARMAPVTRSSRGDKTLLPIAGDDTLERWVAEKFEKTMAVQVVGLPKLLSLKNTTSYRSCATGSHTMIPVPDMWVQMSVRVANSEMFTSLIRQGVGRHRSFGFGMVLVSKAR